MISTGPMSVEWQLNELIARWANLSGNQTERTQTFGAVTSAQCCAEVNGVQNETQIPRATLPTHTDCHGGRHWRAVSADNQEFLDRFGTARVNDQFASKTYLPQLN